MEVKGTLKNKNGKVYHFEVCNNPVTIQDNRLFIFFYEQEKPRYRYEFSYEFENIDDFIEQYNDKEKNLFKYFFNNNTVDFNSLEFFLGDREKEAMMDRDDFKSFYPVINSLYDDYTWGDMYYAIIEDDFNYWCIEERLDQCIARIDDFYVNEDKMLLNLICSTEIKNLKIDDIQRLNNNDELDDFLIEYRELNGLSDKEKQYINLACNFNTDDFVDIVKW